MYNCEGHCSITSLSLVYPCIRVCSQWASALAFVMTLTMELFTFKNAKHQRKKYWRWRSLLIDSLSRIVNYSTSQVKFSLLKKKTRCFVIRLPTFWRAIMSTFMLRFQLSACSEQYICCVTLYFVQTNHLHDKEKIHHISEDPC